MAMRSPTTFVLAAVVTAMGLAYILMPAQNTLDAFSYDSFRYLAGAESILRDGTYLDIDGRPQRIWPPGVSLTYAGAAAATGIEPDRLVPFVNATAYMATAIMLVALAHASRMHWSAAGLMFGAILLNSAVLAGHRKLWSEPPVLALLLAIFLCVASARNDRLLVAATAIASLAIVFRFAMLATIPLLMMAFAILGRRKILTFLPLIAPAPAVLVLRILGGTSSPASRTSRPRALPWQENFHALEELANQFVPARLLGALTVLAVTVLLIYAVISAGRERPLAAIATGWIVCYGAFLLVAQGVASPSFALDLRVLLPMYVGMVIAIAAGIDSVRVHKPAAAALLSVPLLLVPLRGGRQFFSPPRPGSPPCITRQEFVDAIRQQNRRGPISTNAGGVVWYATRQPVRDDAPAAVWLDATNACENVIESSRPAPPRATVVRPEMP